MVLTEQNPPFSNMEGDALSSPIISFAIISDDIVILAKTRWKLKKAIKLLHQISERLKLRMHTEEKHFVGRTLQGFVFLGYFFKQKRKIRPSYESLSRFVTRARRLFEHEGDINRLRLYAERWYSYFHGALFDLASYRGGLKKILVFLEYKLGTKLMRE